MNNKLKKTGEFVLVDDDGTKYIVHEFTTFVSVISDDRQMDIPGIKQFKLRNGDPINFSEDSGFALARNGIRLSKPSG